MLPLWRSIASRSTSIAIGKNSSTLAMRLLTGAIRPDTEVIALTPSVSGGYYDNSRLSEFADLVLEICSHYQTKCIDIRRCGISLDMLPDTLHPNAEGMERISRAVINAMKEE